MYHETKKQSRNRYYNKTLDSLSIIIKKSYNLESKPDVFVYIQNISRPQTINVNFEHVYPK